MKLTIKGIEIECTVDEFEELFVRGLLDKDIKPEDFNELPKVQPFTPQKDNDKYVPRKPFGPYEPNETTIMMYGCGMPSQLNGGITYTSTGPTGEAPKNETT